ncbi:MAG: lipid-binding protein [Hydrocarboniphaga sp.]|uniref:START domain-containing protein n=1 Tax=Hydrocarboniphaga sp. TaxID=2033016 RepID=UPI002632DE34|nr:START domain-containing protein [Hydrocarboniphaga sp.]MDB5971024.1 lipid-binding protein [Hydrocarboniphaga sp.]
MGRFGVLRRVRKLRAFTVAALVLAAPLAAASDADWKLEKDKDGIQIYSRAVPGWQIHEVRGVTRIAARLSSVAAVVTDVAAIPELTDVVAHSEVEHRDSDTRYRVYSMMKMPWPVSNRDILNERMIAQDPATLAVTVTDTATQDLMPLKPDLVRIVKSRQQWTLTPTADGGVLVETRLLSDPAGPMPTSLINAMSVSTPFKTLSKLKELVQRPAYRQATLPFVKEAAPGP